MKKKGGAAGTKSIILDGNVLQNYNINSETSWSSTFIPIEGTQIVSKIISNKTNYVKELQNAKLAEKIDPIQRYLLYPYAVYEITLPENHPLRNNIKEEKNKHTMQIDVNPNSQIFYVFLIVYGGKTLSQLSENISFENAKRMIGDLVYGLSYLHDSRFSHGDMHQFNIVYSLTPSPRLYIIDFGLTKSESTQLDRQKDVENLPELIKFILSNLKDNDKNNIEYKLLYNMKTSLFKSNSLGIILSKPEFECIYPRIQLVQNLVSNNNSPAGTPNSSPAKLTPKRKHSSSSDTPKPSPSKLSFRL